MTKNRSDGKKSESAVPSSPIKTSPVAIKCTTAELGILDDTFFTSASSKEDLTAGEEDYDEAFQNEDDDDDGPDNPLEAAAQIVKGPVSVSTLVGSTVLLEALVIGRPEPTVRWLKGVRLLLFF